MNNIPRLHDHLPAGKLDVVTGYHVLATENMDVCPVGSIEFNINRCITIGVTHEQHRYVGTAVVRAGVYGYF